MLPRRAPLGSLLTAAVRTCLGCARMAAATRALLLLQRARVVLLLRCVEEFLWHVRVVLLLRYMHAPTHGTTAAAVADTMAHNRGTTVPGFVPTHGTTAAAVADTKARIVTDEDANTPTLVPCVVRGVRAVAFLDSGAEATAISPKFARELKLKIHPAEGQLIGASPLWTSPRLGIARHVLHVLCCVLARVNGWSNSRSWSWNTQSSLGRTNGLTLASASLSLLAS